MRNMKKILSFLLVLSMVLSYVPMPALAAEDGTCPHHTHNECGYVAAVEGVDCSHECSDACMTKEVTQCVHNHEAEGCAYTPAVEAVDCDHDHSDCNYVTAQDEVLCICEPQTVHGAECASLLTEGADCDCAPTLAHAEGCNPQAAVAESCDHQHGECAYREAAEERWSCDHVCSADTGCITYACAHVCPADNCGFVEAVAGSDCTNVCEICNAPQVDKAVEAVRALMEALPTVEEMQAMAWADQVAMVTTINNAYAAYEALTAEQKAQLPDPASIFGPLFNYMNAMTELAADVEAMWGSSADNLTESGTLADAIAAAVAGNAAYIQLQKDVPSASTLTISGGNFTIDLNGKEVSCSSDVFKLSTSTAERVDVTICGNGKVISTSGSAVKVSAYSIGNGIYVTLESGSYSGATGLSLTTKKSNATVCAGVSISNTNTFYPAIDVSGGNLTLNSHLITGKDGDIRYNASTDGAINLSGCENPSGLTIYAKTAMPVANVALPSSYALYNGNSPYTEAMVTKGTTVTVKSAAATYTVTFDANGGTGTMNEQTFTSGVAQNLTKNAFSRENYTFTGWNTVADGSGDSYADKENVTISANTTLYAQWEEVKAKYQVTVTGGTVGGEYAEGDTVTITANAPADGKAFAFWTGLDNITITEGSVTSETLTFTMPARSVTVEATYIDAVASVTVNENTKNYATLEAAIAAAVNATGDVEVTLLQSVSLNNPIAVHGGNFTLNLNRNTYANSQTAFNLNDDAKMTITGNGSITSTVHAIDLDANAEVVLESGTFVGGNYAVALRSGNNKLTVGADANLSCNNQFGAPIWSSGTLIVTDNNLTGGEEDIRYDGGTVTLHGEPDGITLKVRLSTVQMPISSLTLPDGYHAFNSDKEILESTETVGLNELVTIGKVADAATPSITAQPVGAEYALNATAEALSVTASVTDGGTLSYQWYSNTTNSNQGGTAINGATSSTYTPATNQGGTVYYYCVVTNTNNDAVFDKTASVTSNAAAIKVHSHEWAYRLKENTTDTIEAYCENTDGGCDNTSGGSVTLSASNSTYDGTAKAASLSAESIVGFSNLSSLIQYQKKNSENWDATTAAAPTDAGAYKASLTVDTDKTIFVEYTIARRNITITADNQEISYGGSLTAKAVTIGGAGLASGDTLDSVTLTPSTTNATTNGTITPKDAVIKNGDKDVTANYAIAYTDGGLIINKANTSIAINGYTPGKTYNSQPLANPTADQLTISGAAYSSVTFTWYKDSVDEANKLTTAPKDAGTYYVVASIAETANTKASSVTSDPIIISQLDISDATITLGAALTYNGTEQTQTVTKVEKNGLTVTYTVSDNTGTGASDNYTLTVTGNGNFTGTATKVWSIGKATVTITAEDKTAVEGDAKPAFTYTVTGLKGDDKLITAPTLTCNANMSKAGEYAITPSNAQAGDNYSITYVAGKLTVKQKHNIKIADTTNGTVTTNVRKAAEGTEVRITVTPKYGYKLSTLTVKDASGKSYVVSTDNNGKYYFTMPDADVTVKATFRKISTATADPTNPKTGDDFHLALWSSILCGSALGMAVLLTDNKKRIH